MGRSRVVGLPPGQVGGRVGLRGGRWSAAKVPSRDHPRYRPAVTIRRLAVFTGARSGHDPALLRLAHRVGADLACRGIGLVYGGGGGGLMGALADGALAAGGEVIGVIPHLMMAREWGRDDLTELHVCSTMHERKAIMAEHADAFLALPGGLGTLEEIFEVWTWRQIGFHVKPVGFLNHDGFWDTLLDALRSLQTAGLVEARDLAELVVAPSLDEALIELNRLLPQSVSRL